MPRKTVLVVDRQPKTRALVRRALQHWDCRVAEAGTGLEALAICASRPVDLLVTELEMPGIGGLRLAAKLSETFPAIPIICMAAAGGAANLPCLLKPLDPEELARALAQVLDAPRKRPAAQPAVPRPQRRRA